MKSSKMVEILKKGNFVVPIYFFQLRDKFNISFECFIFLIYLTNFGDKFIFDPNKYSEELSISLIDIMSYIEELEEFGYINLEVIKNEKGIMEEYVILDLFYDKITNFLIEDINQVDKIDDSKNVFEMIEKEFARPLSPMEFEIISAWLEDGTSEELILEALKEAVYSGVAKLSYIDKIIYEWSKKGIKTKEDVDKNRTNFKKQQEKKEKLDLFEYDWFEDGEDE